MATSFATVEPFTVTQPSKATTQNVPQTVNVVSITVTSSPTAHTATPSSSVAVQNRVDNGLSIAAIAGLGLGVGFIVGIAAATLIYFARRRYAARPRGVPSRDGQALLEYQDEEKQIQLESPVSESQPVAQAAPSARILEWVQRARAVPVPSLASSHFSTVESGNTVIRSHSIVSSLSAYSQASAPASTSRIPDDTSFEVKGGSRRPPGLERIKE
ncbi:hypothetical protein GGX14DRAFT_437922 [Mycena pura]|uniref:Mid2 domain-containing protein n=1 Tax=Mycena pura TaxID=153505 RepID=A0AAD6YJY5_9AGAR|nr:hypothetical protein GGX14DRAFT_437922 [Mycena pura]